MTMVTNTEPVCAAPSRGILIDRFMPRWDIRERHETLIRAPAGLVYEVACNFDLMSVPLIRAIFWLRSKLLRSAPAAERVAKGIVSETIDLGWGILACRPGREIVMGAVTQPWKPNPVFTAVPPWDFESFADPDRVKIVWTIEAKPVNGSLTRYGSETRAVATEDRARAKFRRYWRLVGIGVVLIRRLVGPAVRREAERRHRERQRHARVLLPG